MCDLVKQNLGAREVGEGTDALKAQGNAKIREFRKRKGVKRRTTLGLKKKGVSWEKSQARKMGNFLGPPTGRTRSIESLLASYYAESTGKTNCREGGKRRVKESPPSFQCKKGKALSPSNA